MNNQALNPTIITQADAIVYFIQHMDIDMVNEILEDNRTYQDLDKYIFIHKLGNAFNAFAEGGDTFLNCYAGICNTKMCNYKCSGFSFVGNNSKNYLDFIIIIKEGIVQDIYECSEFKISDKKLEKKERIRINKFEFLFP